MAELAAETPDGRGAETFTTEGSTLGTASETGCDLVERVEAEPVDGSPRPIQLVPLIA